jgi:hypothetical protein
MTRPRAHRQDDSPYRRAGLARGAWKARRPSHCNSK